MLTTPKNWIRNPPSTGYKKHYTDMGLGWLPDGKHGSAEIKTHRTSLPHEEPLIGFRTGLHRQIFFQFCDLVDGATNGSCNPMYYDIHDFSDKTPTLIQPKGRIIRELKVDGIRLMSTDTPEVTGMVEASGNLYGNVLIGGLGLGLVVAVKLRRTQYYDFTITVVENNPDVIELVWPYLEKEFTKRNKKVGLKIVNQDFLTYVKTQSLRKIHSIFVDLWSGTGEWTWMDEVVPVRRAIGRRRPALSHIGCWEEDTMLGQIIGMPPGFSSYVRVANLDSKLIDFKPLWVFRKGIEKEFPTRFHSPLDFQNIDIREDFNRTTKTMANPLFRKYFWEFMGTVGSKSWEQRFGIYWDQFEKPKGDKRDKDTKGIRKTVRQGDGLIQAD